MWYKDYEKGLPFYTVTLDFTLQKQYFAGWCQITHDDKSTSDSLMTTSGSILKYGAGIWDRNIKPFPECDLDANLSLVKKYKSNSLEGKIRAAKLVLSKLQEEQSNIDSWSPEVIDFADRRDFDWSAEELDPNVYTEIHLS